jgi:hypothetical protein
MSLQAGRLPRDDAMFLVRLALGVPSPRAAQLGFGDHAAFGKLSGCDFDALVARCEQLCREDASAGATDQATAP